MDVALRVGRCVHVVWELEGTPCCGKSEHSCCGIAWCEICRKRSLLLAAWWGWDPDKTVQGICKKENQN